MTWLRRHCRHGHVGLFIAYVGRNRVPLETPGARITCCSCWRTILRPR